MSRGPAQAGERRDQKLPQLPAAQGRQEPGWTHLEGTTTFWGNPSTSVHPKNSSLGDLPHLTIKGPAGLFSQGLRRSLRYSPELAILSTPGQSTQERRKGKMQRLDREIYEGGTFTIMHRLPELQLLTSCHHILHRVTLGGGSRDRGGQHAPRFILRKRKEQRGARTGVGKHKPSAQAMLRSATRGLLGSILNAVWQIYAG